MVNDFTGGSFMETHYHSQFDNDDFYDEAVYRLHHELFTLLILALDETAVVPLDFTPVLERILAGGSEITAKVFLHIQNYRHIHILILCRVLAAAF